MRFVPNKRPIPRCFMRRRDAKGIVAEADITPHPHGKLAAKLLVFDKPRSMHRFWKKAISQCPLGRDCLGAVNALGQERQRIGGKGKSDGPKVLTGDPRYFCVVGLCVTDLWMEVVAHEAVHAGFCYEKRVRRNLFGEAASFDEERIAYPAGAIAAAINGFLQKKKLYRPGNWG